MKLIFISKLMRQLNKAKTVEKMKLETPEEAKGSSLY